MDARFVPVENWPGKPTQFRHVSGFRATYAKTLNLLDRELSHVHAKNVVVQADFRPNQLRLDGWPRGGERPAGPRVIVSFTNQLGKFSFPCDRYTRFEDNMRAIALSLEALRAVDRYGVTQQAEQYQGWKKLEAAAPSARDKRWAAEFIAAAGGSSRPDALLQDAVYRQIIYREAAKRLHPDAGGDHDKFVDLQEAMRLLNG